jgi:hypothetical protein
MIPEGSSRRADLACLAILGLIWIAMAVLANPIGDFPLNDDWVYGLAVKSILESGQFRLPSPASSNLFPQAYWGALFCLPSGFSFTALRLSTLVLGLLGVWATFGILRQLGAGARIASLAAALIAGNPVYFALANTFMTDVPFVAIAAASLFFLVRWSLHSNARDALLGLLLAMVAILIRQAGIVIPLGFAAAYYVTRGPGLRAFAVAIGPVLLGVLLHFGFQAWLHQTGGTPSAGEPPLFATVTENLRNAFRVPLRLVIFFAYVGLFSLPILAVASLRVWERSDDARRRMFIAVFVAASVLSVAAMFMIGRPMPFIDNILNNFGMGPLTLTDNYFAGRNLPQVPVYLKAFWNVVTLAAISGAGLLACMVAHGFRGFTAHRLASASAPAAIIIACSTVAYVVLALLALRFFYDRYFLFPLLSAVLFAGLLHARTPSDDLSRKGGALLGLVLMLQATFAVVATRDYLEWNRTRWAATNGLLAAGVPRTSIDGGYEFNGWLGYDAGYQRKQGKSPWWVDDDEYIIASGPMPGYSVFRAYPLRRLLTGRETPVLVLRRDRP